MPPKAKVIVVAAERFHGRVNAALNRAEHTPLFDASDLESAEELLRKLQKPPDVALIAPIRLKDRGNYKRGDGDRIAARFVEHLGKKFPETQTVYLSTHMEDEKPPFCDIQFSAFSIEGGLASFITSFPPRARR